MSRTTPAAERSWQRPALTPVPAQRRAGSRRITPTSRRDITPRRAPAPRATKGTRHGRRAPLLSVLLSVLRRRPGRH